MNLAPSPKAEKTGQGHRSQCGKEDGHFVLVLSHVWPLLCWRGKPDENRRCLAGSVARQSLYLRHAPWAMGHGRGAEFGAGFVTSEVITQGFKAGLGKSSINRRPSDVDHGTPSVHTALAVFGATSLARKCAPDLPVKGGLAFGAAAVVAASRVDAGKHTVGQGNLWIILPMASRPIFPQAGSPLAIR